ALDAHPGRAQVGLGRARLRRRLQPDDDGALLAARRVAAPGFEARREIGHAREATTRVREREGSPSEEGLDVDLSEAEAGIPDASGLGVAARRQAKALLNLFRGERRLALEHQSD